MNPTRRITVGGVKGMILLLAVGLASCAPAPATRTSTEIPQPTKQQVLVAYGELPLSFEANEGQADPKAITLAFEGVKGVAIDALGDLVLRADGSEVSLRKPFVYQEREGQRAVIPTRYVLKAERQVSFDVAAYDATKPLIIDPVLAYSTYLGGSGGDQGFGVAVDAAGNAYVTGLTGSTDFPTTA